MTQSQITFPPSNPTPTSRAAALAAQPTASSKRLIVLAYIREHGGATIDEIAVGADLLTQSVCGRVDELRKLGLIRDSGKTRLTRNGRAASVLEATA